MEEGDIRFLSKVYSVRGRIDALVVAAMGMKATNDQRIHLGQSMAYEDDAFRVIARKINNLAIELDNL